MSSKQRTGRAVRCSVSGVLAAVGDTPYNIVRLVHLFTIIVGTGLTFAAPIMAVQARRDGGKLTEELLGDAASRVIFPMLLIAGMAGGALVGMSDDFWDFSQTWLSIGGALWVAILALVLAAYPRPYLQVFNLAPERRKMLGGMLHLAMSVMLVLMVWKFGAPESAL